MKCQKCVEAGEKSTVYVGGSISTCMAGPEFYDEEGRFHDHDPNAHTTAYTCSRGHDWRVTTYEKCPSCDYNADR